MGCSNTKEGELSKYVAKVDLCTDSQTNLNLITDGAIPASGVANEDYIIGITGRLQEIYDIDQNQLGKGSRGFVCMATQKSTKTTRVIKHIPKERIRRSENRFKQEISIIKAMDHLNIMKCVETFEDPEHVFVALELCSGGSLVDRVAAAAVSGRYGEAQAASLFKQIMQAVTYMHNSLVCHRDLKPEKMFLSTHDSLDKAIVKVSGFGAARRFDRDMVMTTRVGSPHYVAPQVLGGIYDQRCDYWSSGVLLYTLLCGDPPFRGETEAEVVSQIRVGRVSFDSSRWGTVTEDAKTLVSSLLAYNPKRRARPQDCVLHAWTRRMTHAQVNPAERPLPQAVGQRLRSFQAACRLRTADMQKLSERLEDKHAKSLLSSWSAADQTGDGYLTFQDCKGAALSGVNALGESDVQLLMDTVGAAKTDDVGTVVNYKELLTAAQTTKAYWSDDPCWSAFNVFDVSGEGRIPKEVLEQILADGLGDDDAARQQLSRLSPDGNGTIDFQTFMEVMRAAET
eukprot:TRINITY_DN32828_c0_g2_i1.p1 TRINITY_DN32828_c0_g2~~TRINITY_DN32828_c0_g2_i1.p1  ORF type:complete len:535 (-),score=122.39 TRINITY_DN32828_c0_g2_i1:619-2151(-)